MASISGWAAIMITVIMLAALSEALTPSETFKKYLRFAVGLVMIFIIARPIVSLGSGQGFDNNTSFGYILPKNFEDTVSEDYYAAMYKRQLELAIVTAYKCERAEVELTVTKGEYNITAIKISGADEAVAAKVAADFDIGESLVTIKE